MLLALADEVIE